MEQYPSVRFFFGLSPGGHANKNKAYQMQNHILYKSICQAVTKRQNLCDNMWTKIRKRKEIKSLRNASISGKIASTYHSRVLSAQLRTLDFAEAHTDIYKKSNNHVTTTNTRRAIRNGGRSFFTQIANKISQYQIINSS